jgi:hypothetical protein
MRRSRWPTTSLPTHFPLRRGFPRRRPRRWGRSRERLRRDPRAASPPLGHAGSPLDPAVLTRRHVPARRLSQQRLGLGRWRGRAAPGTAALAPRSRRRRPRTPRRSPSAPLLQSGRGLPARLPRDPMPQRPVRAAARARPCRRCSPRSPGCSSFSDLDSCLGLFRDRPSGRRGSLLFLPGIRADALLRPHVARCSATARRRTRVVLRQRA